MRHNRTVMLKYIKTDSDSVLGICLFKQEEQEI